MLKLTDLALRQDLQLGPMLVSPSRRLVEGPGGFVHVEPLIMQVFLLLLDAGGKVVTRGELFDQCWGGVYVGDDSLNRAIARVRRTGAQVAPGLYEIETIPRTGYRLTGEILRFLDGHAASAGEAGPAPVSRRLLIGGGAAAAGLAGAGLWWTAAHGGNRRFEALMAKGDDAFRNGSALDDASVAEGSSQSMMDLYREAVRADPGSARAWGLLAYFTALAADNGPPVDAGRLVAESQRAVRRALAIDAREPNALVALFLLQGPMLDWRTRDRRLRSILAIDPDNLPAMTELMPLVQAAGLTRESWMWNERILHASPFARAFLVIKSMKLWILGDVPASDLVIDRVRGLWPTYDFGFFVRLMLFTLTGRPRAALAMIAGAPKMVEDAPFWRAAAEALESRSPAAVEAARVACFATARQSPWMTNQAVMVLCALGLKDDAFELTDGYLLWRGKAISTGQASGREINDYNRRMTQWLFTPPCAVMRADPRFQKLCDAFGLTAYWRARHIRPDYQVYG